MSPGIFEQFVILWVVIDPVGTIPVFVAVTARIPPERRPRIARQAAAVATGILLFFLILGQFLIDALGIALPAFQIAGGIVLFLFAMTMIFGDSKPVAEIEAAERDHLSGAVFPLAMPSIASPGAMLAIVILTDNDTTPLTEQLVTAAMLIVVLVVTLALLLAASAIHRLIGSTGASVISRVMGIVLATIAVDSVLQGFDTLGVLDVAGEAVLSTEE